MDVNNPFFNLLTRTTIREVCSKKAVIGLSTKDTARDALKRLARYKIIAAPVVDDNKKFVGMVDGVVLATALSTGQIKDLDVKLGALFDGNKDKPIQILDNVNVAYAVGLLSGAGEHRMVVYPVDEQDEIKKEEDKISSIYSICSQSDLVRFILDHIDHSMLEHGASQAISALGYGTKPVVSASSTSPVHAVLKTLADNKGASCVAIVDEAGLLVGNFSASDLRGLDADSLSDDLALPVVDFLAKKTPASLKPITRRKTESMYYVTDTIVNNRLHHVWIVEDGKPIGIVTLTDILHLVSNFKDHAPKKKWCVLEAPGRLKVVCTRATDLPTVGNDWSKHPVSLRATFPADGRMKRPKIVKSTKPSNDQKVGWDKAAVSSIITERDGISKRRVLFEVVDDKGTVLAGCSIDLHWVLNGFGTGVQNMSTTDTFQLYPKGALELDIYYSPLPSTIA